MTYEHQIWQAGTTREIDTNETNKAGAGDIILYLYYQSFYSHHTLQNGNLP